jgi:hypothetical protein
LKINLRSFLISHNIMSVSTKYPTINHTMNNLFMYQDGKSQIITALLPLPCTTVSSRIMFKLSLCHCTINTLVCKKSSHHTLTILTSIWIQHYLLTDEEIQFNSQDQISVESLTTRSVTICSVRTKKISSHLNNLNSNK